MSRCLPQFQVVDVGRDNFLVPSYQVLSPDKVDELVVDLRSMRVEESCARRELMEVKKFLLLSNIPVISLSCFLYEV